MKVQQLSNPEYAGISLNTKPRYAKLMGRFNAMTAHINTTITMKRICGDSDDEDCIKDPFRNCHEVEPNTPGSGSGSGSGSGGSPGDGSNNDGIADSDRDVKRPIKISEVSIFDNNVPVDHNREIFRPMEEQTTTHRDQTGPTTTLVEVDVLHTIGGPNYVEPMSTGGQDITKTTTEIATATTTTTTTKTAKLTTVTTRATSAAMRVIKGETETSQADSNGMEVSTSSSPELIVLRSSSCHMIPALTTALLTSLSVLCS